MRIQIGTRKSALALWQAEYVAQKLEEHGMDAELVAINTIGDKVLNKTISKIGSKGVFTEELEAMLATGQIHIAVHSAKDMQSTLPKGMDIIAFAEREDAHDVIVSYNQDFEFDETQKLVLGSSSVRRVAFMKHYYPKVRVSDVRGNLQTRMHKLEEGSYDGLILAKAGVIRSGMTEHIVATLPFDEFVPPVGQGSVAIQGSPMLGDATRSAIIRAVNHEQTAVCIRAERSFLRVMDGGCSIPAFALGTLSDDGKNVHLVAGIIDLNGKELVKQKGTATVSKGEQLGKKLAESVLKAGGKKILAKIKNRAL